MGLQVYVNMLEVFLPPLMNKMKKKRRYAIIFLEKHGGCKGKIVLLLAICKNNRYYGEN